MGSVHDEVVGFHINRWCRSVGISRGKFYSLDIQPRLVKLGVRTIITEKPADYLARVERAQSRRGAPARA